MKYQMICPKCKGLIQYGRWILITVLDYDNNVTGWKARWEPNQYLVCPYPEHGEFDREGSL